MVLSGAGQLFGPHAVGVHRECHTGRPKDPVQTAPCTQA